MEENKIVTTESKAVTTHQERNITDMVLARVQDLSKRGDLRLPKNYSAENAMKSAYLKLQETYTGKNDGQKPVLEACTKVSITNTLLSMVIQGLNPNKNQCYFVAYGGKLQLMRSYLGTVAVAKSVANIGKPVANCIYEGDVFKTKIDVATGEKVLVEHEQPFENINIDKIKGAYCLIPIEGVHNPHLEIMNIDQIRKAWNQGQAKGNSGAHTNFTDEMCKKTVIQRACKMFINTSDDSNLYEYIQETDDLVSDEDPNKRTLIEAEVAQEIEENAGTVEVDIEPESVTITEADIEVEKETDYPDELQSPPKNSGRKF